MFFFLISLTCDMLAVGAMPTEITVRSLDGVSKTGSLIAWTEEEVIVATADGEHKLPVGEVEKITFPTTTQRENPVGVQIQLVDRTELVAQSFTAKNGQAEIIWKADRRQTIPLELVRSVHFAKENKALHKAWEQLRDKPRRGDRLAVRKEKKIDYVEGVISEVTPDRVLFLLGEESLPVKRTKLSGLLFADRTTDRMLPTQCRLVTVDGSRIPVAQWKSTPEGLSLVLSCGLTLGVAYDQMSEIDFAEEKIVYLSDLEPILAEWTPYLAAGKLGPLLARFYSPQNDRPVGGYRQGSFSNRLEIVGKATEKSAVSSAGPSAVESYARGLSVHSKSRLIYDLPPDARRFEARVGIDASLVHLGSVRLTILGDGRSLYAEDISGLTGPRDVAVALGGVQRLEIIVDYGENQDTGDRLNLCNARIVK